MYYNDYKDNATSQTFRHHSLKVFSHPCNLLNVKIKNAGSDESISEQLLYISINHEPSVN